MMRTPTLREVDVLSGALLAALGLFVAFQGLGLGFYDADVPGPGFFPTVLAVLLTIAGLTLVVTRLRAHTEKPATVYAATDNATEAAAEAVTESPDEEAATRAERPYVRPLALWAVIFVASLLVGLVGFPIAMLGLTAVVLFGIERRRGIGAVVTTLAIPLLAWLLFAVLLQVPLPTGPFGI